MHTTRQLADYLTSMPPGPPPPIAAGDECPDCGDTVRSPEQAERGLCQWCEGAPTRETYSRFDIDGRGFYLSGCCWAAEEIVDQVEVHGLPIHPGIAGPGAITDMLRRHMAAPWLPAELIAPPPAIVRGCPDFGVLRFTHAPGVEVPVAAWWVASAWELLEQGHGRRTLALAPGDGCMPPIGPFANHQVLGWMAAVIEDGVPIYAAAALMRRDEDGLHPDQLAAQREIARQAAYGGQGRAA